MNKDHWFLTNLSYENKHYKKNLFAAFSSFGNGIKRAEIYTSYPVEIPSYPIKEPEDLEEILDYLSKLDFIQDIKVYVPKRFKFLENYNYNVILQENLPINFSVINLTLSNSHSLIEKIPKTKFQIGDYARRLKRKLELQDKTVLLDQNLENAFLNKNNLDNLQREFEYEINKLPLEFKPHLILNEVFELYRKDLNNVDSLITILNKIKKRPYLIKHIDDLDISLVINKVKEINNSIADIESSIIKADNLNYMTSDKNNLEYRIVLNYNKENLTNLQLLGVKGIYFMNERISKEEILKQPSVIIDLEKPLWKQKFEKPLIEAREDLLSLLGKNSDNDQELKNLIQDIEKNLTIYVDGREVKLFEDEYDAIISNYVIVKIMPNGERIKEYHKIKNFPDKNESEFINGFKVFGHKDERTLIREISRSLRLKETKPYFVLAYNAPYDIIQSREAVIKFKLGKFDIGAIHKNPKRNYVRKINQRLEIPGVEIFDPFRLYKELYPSQENHKLESFVNFARKMNNVQEEFKKIATHEELRELKIKAMNGDEKADFILDKYTTSDGNALDLDYSFYLNTIFMIKDLAPHLSLTEIIFSPRIAMRELHKKLFYDKYHIDRFFGSHEKIREDERQIVKKHLEIFKKKLLKKENIKIIHSEGKVIQAYLPLELLLKDSLIKVYPKWQNYFDSLEDDLIKKYGMLQPPNSFFDEILVDLYFYVKERNIYKRHLNRRNLDNNLIREFLIKEFDKLSAKGKSLLNNYDEIYERLRNFYRGIYKSLPNEFKSSIRTKPLHLEDEFEQEGLVFEEKNMFNLDNEDLILTYNINAVQEKFFSEKTLKLLKTFKSSFNAFNNVSKNLESLIGNETEKETSLSKKNISYLINQRKRITKKKNNFLLAYSLDPEKLYLDFVLTFKNLAKQLINNKIILHGLEKDYLYVNGDLKNTMLLPLRTITLKKKKEN